LKKPLALIAFSVLLLVPVGFQNMQSGQNFITIPSAEAHKNPSNCDSLFLRVIFLEMFDSSTSNQITSAVEGETVFFQGVLVSEPIGCNYEGGTVHIILPNGNVVLASFITPPNTSPPNTVACIGSGTAVDPDTTQPHDCLVTEQVFSQRTNFVPYVVDNSDDGLDDNLDGSLTAKVDYGGALGTSGAQMGFAHSDSGDSLIQTDSASRSLRLENISCGDGTELDTTTNECLPDLESICGDGTTINNMMCVVSLAVGGLFLGVDKPALFLAAGQLTAAWVIPVIVSGIGFAIVIARKF